MKQPFLILIIGLLLSTILIAGCTEETEQITIKINGSTTVFPIIQRCAEQFNENQETITVIVETPAVGSGGGISLLGEQSIDIACASRPVKSSEENSYEPIDFHPTVIAYDGVAVIVHHDLYNQGLTALTKEQLKGIYNGSIPNWNEINSGINASIQVHQRELGSGTRDTFMDAIFEGDGEVTETALSWSSNPDLKTAVENDNSSIGYVGLGFVDENTPSLALDTVVPSEETIKDKSYLINRALFLYTDGEPTESIKTFIDYVKTDAGQTIVENNGFIKI